MCEEKLLIGRPEYYVIQQKFKIQPGPTPNI